MPGRSRRTGDVRLKSGRMLRITVWHGESKTLFYLMRYNPDDEEDWETLSSHPTHEEAYDEMMRVLHEEAGR